MTHILPLIQYEGKVCLYNTNLCILDGELHNLSHIFLPPSAFRLKPSAWLLMTFLMVGLYFQLVHMGFFFFLSFLCVVPSVETFKNF